MSSSEKPVVKNRIKFISGTEQEILPLQPEDLDAVIEDEEEHD